MSTKKVYSELIKREALNLGFMHCGISRAGFLEEEAPRLEAWLKKGMHGKMQYMENHFDKRLNPELLVDGARSVISLLLNYYPSEKQDGGTPLISKYAYGEDYHFVIKDKLKQLLAVIRNQIGEVNGRVFVDSAPVMDKAWARKSGLGWIGKHSNLINQRKGSYFFIAELITDLELEEDGPVADHCGTCTRCIDACPTGAISPYEVDGSKCISYFTIELKDAIPEGMEDAFGDWVFGCDICQDVCPWNRFAEPHREPAFEPDARLLTMSEKEWHELTEDVFGEIFRKSAVKRTKYSGLKRNLNYIRRKRIHRLP